MLVLLCALAAAPVTGTVNLSSGRPGALAVVYLEGKERGTPMPRAVVDQRDREFKPHVMVVTVGTRVDFPNNDVVYHNVFSEYHGQKFDFGVYPRGKSKSQVFDKPGLAVLLCSIHPEMSAYVMCVDTPYFAVADKRGRFSIPSVPAGEYTLRAWHETGEKDSRPVTIGAGGALEIRTKR